MGLRRYAHSLSGIPTACAMLGILIGVILVAGAEANAISRRRAIVELLAKQNVDSTKEWRIGVKNMPPMCFYDSTLPDNERFSGFYIDFWKQMNEDLLLNYSFHIYNNNLDVISALNNDEIDIGLGLSITWKRALEVDFTQPIVDGSLRIMTRNRSGMNIWELFMPFHWTLWVTILILALVNGHIIWLVERDSNFYYFPKFYFSGIREGLWFSFMNLMMMDDGVVRSFPGKLVKFGSTFTGVILIAIYTATVTSLLTTGDINNRIGGPQDLIGTKVGSNFGSTASEYVSGYGGMQLTLFPNGHDAFMALKHGKVPAIIMDYPVLVYYSRLYPDPNLNIVENILEYDLIGIAMRRNASMIATLNGVIVSLTQTGYSGQLSDKWVGLPKPHITTSYDFFDTVGLWVWMGFWCFMGLVAFLLKKFVIKKRYKKSPWFSSLGGEDLNLLSEPPSPSEKPLLSVRNSRRQFNQTLAMYSEGESEGSEYVQPITASGLPSLSIQDESAYEDDVM